MSKRRTKKQRKGIVLIVEGPSDQTVLEGYLECVFPNCVVETSVFRGDLTCGLDKNKKRIRDYNPKKVVEGIVLKALMKNGWQPQDVKGVIHVTDTDGAYVDDSYVQEDQTIECKMLCTDRALLSKNPAATKMRNHFKRRYTLELLRHSKLQNYGWDIDYELYYMSTNLEHVTQGSYHPFSMEEKNNLAIELRNRCFEDGDYALRLFSDQSLEGKTLDGSWDFIMSDAHSLERHTNLGLLNP